MRHEQTHAIVGDLGKRVEVVERQIDAMLDKIVGANAPSVITALESRVTALESKKRLLVEKQRDAQAPRRTMEQSLEHALTFLSNPWKLWQTGELEVKRTVLKLAFSAPILFSRNIGARAPKTTIPFSILAEISNAKTAMVRAAGLEPARPKPPDFKSGMSTNSITPANCGESIGGGGAM